MKRSYTPELMDDFSINDLRIDIALRELKTINKFLGGISTTKTALKIIWPYNKKVTVLDVGAGSSDILINVQRLYPQLEIISADKNLRALNYSEEKIIKVNIDAFSLPFKDNSIDLIHLSLFLHHFSEEQINQLLIEFLRISNKGIIINDLQRSYLALLGIKLLTVLFSRSELVKNDAPLSVERAFKKKELESIFIKAGIAAYDIKWKWAFRWMVVIKK